MKLSIKQLLNHRVLKDIVLLMTGTAIAQVIGIVVLPVLSRVYSPESFGVLGTLTSIAGIIVVTGSLKYELAIVLPSSEEKRSSLSILSFFILSLFSFATLIAVIILKDFLSNLIFGNSAYSYYLFFIPFYIFFLGALNIIFQFLSSEKRFADISIIKVTTTSFANLFNVVTGLFSSQTFLLITGQAMGLVASTFYFAAKYKKKLLNTFNSVSLSKMMTVAKEYKNFPIFTAPQHFLNAVSQNVPVIMLASFFGIEITGFYVMSRRFLQLPAQLISESIRPVLYKKMAEKNNRNEKMTGLLIKSTGSLFAIAVIPAIIFGFWAEELFVFFLGSNWAMTGKMSKILMPWIALVFINPPSTLLLLVFGRQKMLLVFDIVLAASRVGSIFIGYMLFQDAIKTIYLFSAVGIIFNIFIIIYALFTSKEGICNERRNCIN